MARYPWQTIHVYMWSDLDQSGYELSNVCTFE